MFQTVPPGPALQASVSGCGARSAQVRAVGQPGFGRANACLASSADWLNRAVSKGASSAAGSGRSACYLCQQGLGNSGQPNRRWPHDVMAVAVFQGPAQVCRPLSLDTTAPPVHAAHGRATFRQSSQYSALSLSCPGSGTPHRSQHNPEMNGVSRQQGPQSPKSLSTCGTANRAAGRINETQRRLKPACHRFIVSAMNDADRPRGPDPQPPPRNPRTGDPALFLHETARARDQGSSRIWLTNPLRRCAVSSPVLLTSGNAAFPHAAMLYEDAETLDTCNRNHGI